MNEINVEVFLKSKILQTFNVLLPSCQAITVIIKLNIKIVLRNEIECYIFSEQKLYYHILTIKILS